MKFLHLSDLHFHRSNSDNKEALAVLAFVKKTYPEHYLIVTGDITDDGHYKQYECAQKALKDFKGRVFVCPGNHDFGALGNLYSYERALRFDEYLSVPLEQGGTFTGDNTPVVNMVRDGKTEVMVIALDTNLETNHVFDFACGEVGECQMAGLKNIIENPCSDRLVKLLMFHHHPFITCHPFMELKDGRELVCTIYGRVNLVLFGHKHVSSLRAFPDQRLYYLASDNSPGKDFAREILVEGTAITIQDALISKGAA